MEDKSFVSVPELEMQAPTLWDVSSKNEADWEEGRQ